MAAKIKTYRFVSKVPPASAVAEPKPAVTPSAGRPASPGKSAGHSRAAEAHAMVAARKAGTWRGGGLGKRGSTTATNAPSAGKKKAPKSLTVVHTKIKPKRDGVKS